MITVTTEAAAEGRNKRPVGAGAGRQRICPAGAKTRDEAWQRAAECYAEMFGLPDKSVVIVRDGAMDYGIETRWTISRSVDGRYIAQRDPKEETSHDL